VDDLRTIAAQYAENFELAMVDKDKKLPDMIRDLDTNISRINDQLMMLSAQLEEGIFVDALHITTPTPVLAELDKVCTCIIDTISKHCLQCTALVVLLYICKIVEYKALLHWWDHCQTATPKC
jgi:hypothetical protein